MRQTLKIIALYACLLLAMGLWVNWAWNTNQKAIYHNNQ